MAAVVAALPEACEKNFEKNLQMRVNILTKIMRDEATESGRVLQKILFEEIREANIATCKEVCVKLTDLVVTREKMHASDVAGK